jgi:hypothetical protein
LHEGLIKYNPGCRLPNMPEKSIWCNLYINNDSKLDKRKSQIENYLQYITNHKHLQINPVFRLFISDQFEKYKESSNKESKIQKHIEYIKSLIPDILKINTIKQINYDDNLLAQIDREKDNFDRLEKGVSETLKYIVIYL